MRRSSLFLLAFGMTVAPAVLAQSSGTWANTDPGCDDGIFSQTVQAANEDQAQAEKDANAINDYLKKIKEGPRNASDKLLSCVDVSWPDLPFSGVLPGIEEYITKVGDKAVEEACNKMRDQVRRVDSVFNTADLKIGQLQGVAGQVVDSYNRGADAYNRGSNAVGVPSAPTPSTDDGGAFGGLIDLIKPPTRPRPNPNPTP